MRIESRLVKLRQVTCRYVREREREREGGWERETFFWFPSGARTLYFPQLVQASFKAHKVSTAVSGRRAFLGTNRPKRQADYFSESSAKLQNEWTYASFPIRRNGKHEHKFTIYTRWVRKCRLYWTLLISLIPRNVLCFLTQKQLCEHNKAYYIYIYIYVQFFVLHVSAVPLSSSGSNT